jgi:hypothetical protein
MRSPIILLETAIAGAAFLIAPERESELKVLDEVHKFVLVPTDEKGFAIRVNTKTHEVILPVAALEYIWCCAHLLHVLYVAYVTAQRSGAPQLDLANTPGCSKAIDLVNWATRNMILSGVEQWPLHMPAPVSDPESGTDIHIANELFLLAVAWLIHHEMSHVALGHQPAERLFSQQKEKEADLRATEWIVSLGRTDEERQKRSLGIATALLSMQFLDRPEEILDGYVRSHPISVERLDYCLTRANAQDDGIVCAFATVGLQFHLGQFGITAPLDGKSIRDVLSGFMVAFARSSHERKDKQ